VHVRRQAGPALTHLARFRSPRAIFNFCSAFAEHSLLSRLLVGPVYGRGFSSQVRSESAGVLGSLNGRRARAT
jgi:hypothetical protein